LLKNYLFFIHSFIHYSFIVHKCHKDRVSQFETTNGNVEKKKKPFQHCLLAPVHNIQGTATPISGQSTCFQILKERATHQDGLNYSPTILPLGNDRTVKFVSMSRSPGTVLEKNDRCYGPPIRVVVVVVYQKVGRVWGILYCGTSAFETVLAIVGGV
jgi:hypothetical protein